MINSRRKGADFERKLAEIFRKYGYTDSRRGQQYCGANGDADVVGLPHIHVEAKAVEKLNLYDAISQSKRDAKRDEIPIVVHKKNRQNILVTMELPDFMTLYREFEKGTVTDIEIEKMDFSVRSYNCLKRAGINSLKDLSEKNVSDLMNVRNLGQRCLGEVIEKCKEYGVIINAG